MNRVEIKDSLLFGAIALQLDLASADSVLGAVRRWASDRTTSLPELISAESHLESESLDRIDRLIRTQWSSMEVAPGRGLSKTTGWDQLNRMNSATSNDFSSMFSKNPQSRMADGTRPTTEENYVDSDASRRYKIVSEIGQGGQGKVYSAIDREVPRTVAYKELREERSNSQQFQERFRYEAYITGRLEHPGVVPIYGMGSYRNGKPFYAMRYIQGESLRHEISDVHRQHSRLDFTNVEFRRLLRRFIDVCNTIDYAHSQQILHRDLKPDNVMLGEFGETIVVDWGLAKDLREQPNNDVDGTLQISATNATQFGSVVGTPQFMSPEQASGKLAELGPATDIYGLGAILYEMIVGQPPFNQENVDALLDDVRAGNLVRPRSIDRRVPKPLESICLKAMAHSAPDRYCSAGDLALDIENYLADGPVAAHRESWLERTRRFLRNNRQWSAAIAALLIVTSITFGVATLLVNEARQNERLARLGEQERRIEATDFLIEAKESVDLMLTTVGADLENFPALDSTRRELFAQAAESYRRFTARRSNTPEIQFEQGRSQVRLAKLERKLGNSQRAMNEFQLAEYRFRKLATGHSSLVKIANLERADTLLGMGLVNADLQQYEECAEKFKSALVALESALVTTPSLRRRVELKARTHLNYANCLSQQGRLESARAHARLAIDQAKKMDDHTDAMLIQCKANILLGQILSKETKWRECRVATEAAVASCNQLHALDPLEARFIKLRSDAFQLQGKLFRDMAAADLEQTAYANAALDYEQLCQLHPNVPDYTHRLAMSLINLGQIYRRRAWPQEANRYLHVANETLRTLGEKYPKHLDYAASHAVCATEIATSFDDSGQFDMARPRHDEAVEALRILTRQPSPKPEYLDRYAVNLCNQARSFASQGKWLESESAYCEAIEVLEAIVRDDDTIPRRMMLALAYERWANNLILANREPQSHSYFAKAKEHWKFSIPIPTAAPTNILLEAARFLGTCQVVELRESELAKKYASLALERSPENPDVLSIIGAMMAETSNTDSARKHLNLAIAKRQDIHAQDYFWLSIALAKDQRHEDAAQAYQKGHSWWQRRCPGHHELFQLSRRASAELARQNVKVKGI